MTSQPERKKVDLKSTEMRLCKEKVCEKKDKYLKFEFQQIVLTTLLNKDKKNKTDEKNEKQFEIPEKFDISLNLSNMNLTQFPKELLDKTEKVEYLYLEGNELSTLPTDFFKKLPSLKWLDLRNNILLCLPTEGLQNHCKLEIILLQGNRIRNLPIELAMVPYLKGLQTTGNPLMNVPQEAIAEGFQGIIKHLKNLCVQNDICYPVLSTVFGKPSTSEDIQSKQSCVVLNNRTDSDFISWSLHKSTKWKHYIAKQSKKSFHIDFRKNSKLRIKTPVIQEPKISVYMRSYPKLSTKSRPFRCGVYHNNRNIVSALNFKMKKSKLGYKRKPITLETLQEKARRELQAAQMREVLEKQAKKIQRMKDKEALKSWRDHAKISQQQIKLLDNFQQYPCKDFARKIPFDLDPEFMNMLNRVDLYKNLREFDNRYKKFKKNKIKINTLDLEKQMNEIILKLQNLNTKENEVKSPRSKRNHMCNKMEKILDIQKTLKKLQSLNSTMSGIMPLLKQNQNIK